MGGAWICQWEAEGSVERPGGGRRHPLSDQGTKFGAGSVGGVEFCMSKVLALHSRGSSVSLPTEGTIFGISGPTDSKPLSLTAPTDCGSASGASHYSLSEVQEGVTLLSPLQPLSEVQHLPSVAQVDHGSTSCPVHCPSLFP